MIFLGVGEAFDEAQPNTCLLVQSPEVTLLLDCGFTAISQVWEALPDPETLDAVYLSHTHADHLFGLPGLLVRYAEEGRQKPLTILGRPGMADHVKRVLDFAYPGIAARLTYQLHFGVLDPAGVDKPEGISTLNADASEAIIGDLWLRVAPTQHSVPSMALRIDWSGPDIDLTIQQASDVEAPARTTATSTATAIATSTTTAAAASLASRRQVSFVSLCYSGDGMWTQRSAELYAGCDLLVHECYLKEGDARGHASVEAAIQLFNRAQPKRMALVHLKRTLRPRSKELLMRFAKEGLAIDIPQAGEVVEF